MHIRRAQLSALADAQLERFSARMLVHMRRFFPQHFASLGEEKALILVQHGIERGAAYGITSERDVCKLVDLMLALGPDMDKKFPWVASRLSDTATSPSVRINEVYETLLASLRSKAGRQ